jgi:hypothetical protein
LPFGGKYLFPAAFLKILTATLGGKCQALDVASLAPGLGDANTITP